MSATRPPQFDKSTQTEEVANKPSEVKSPQVTLVTEEKTAEETLARSQSKPLVTEEDTAEETLASSQSKPVEKSPEVVTPETLTSPSNITFGDDKMLEVALASSQSQPLVTEEDTAEVTEEDTAEETLASSQSKPVEKSPEMVKPDKKSTPSLKERVAGTLHQFTQGSVGFWGGKGFRQYDYTLGTWLLLKFDQIEKIVCDGIASNPSLRCLDQLNSKMASQTFLG